MKIWEINFIDGKLYKDDGDLVWKVVCGDLIRKVYNEYRDISEEYTMVDILDMEFEEFKS